MYAKDVERDSSPALGCELGPLELTLCCSVLRAFGAASVLQCAEGLWS